MAKIGRPLAAEIDLATVRLDAAPFSWDVAESGSSPINPTTAINNKVFIVFPKWQSGERSVCCWSKNARQTFGKHSMNPYSAWTPWLAFAMEPLHLLFYFIPTNYTGQQANRSEKRGNQVAHLPVQARTNDRLDLDA